MILLKGHSDRAVQNHRHVTGATDTYWLNELVRYVRGQGLWDNFVFYPMMPKTNYGTGSSVRPLGGLTSNAMTLVNGPTWGASGLSFSGSSSQYGNVGPIDPSTGLTVFTRLAHASATPSATEVFFGSFGGDGFRSFVALLRGVETGDPYDMLRTSEGNLATTEGYDTAGGDHTTSDQCLVWQWQNADARALWQNKTSLSLTNDSGTPQSSTYNNSLDVYFMANNENPSPAAFMNATAKALAFLTGTVTDTQRETITDLINMIGKPPPLHALREYVAETGATNTLTLDRLTRYISDEGLWDNFALYSMTDGTNYGSGSSVAVLGGLTSNAMTLVNGPTWGAGGVAFASASSQYGSIPDFLGSETLTLILRSTESNPSGVTTLISQFDSGGDRRSFWVQRRGGETGEPYRLLRYSDGGSSAFEAYDTSSSSDSDKSFVAQWVDGGGRSAWLNKSSESLSLVGGSTQTSRYNSNVDILLNASYLSGSPSIFGDQTTKALAFLTGTVTDAQRETITDLINEL